MKAFYLYDLSVFTGWVSAGTLENPEKTDFPVRAIKSQSQVFNRALVMRKQ